MPDEPTRPELDLRDDDALGTYISPATAEEVLSALRDHTPGEWVATLQGADGGFFWRKSGWSWFFTENDEEATFAVTKEAGAGSPSVSVDAPLVLHFSKALGMDGPNVRTTRPCNVVVCPT